MSMLLANSNNIFTILLDTIKANPVAYSFSLVTAILAIIMVQFRGMALILIGHITTNLLTALSYFFVGGWSGSAICFTAIVQCIIMFLYERKKKEPPLFIIILFIAAFITCSIILYSSIFDIFSAAAAVGFAVSVGQSKPFYSRIYYSMAMIFWVVYDISCQQYANLIMHAVIFISTVVAMIRVDGIFRKKQIAETEKTDE